MTNNSSLYKRLEHAISRSRGTRFIKVKKAPLNLTHSKILELITSLFNKSVKVKAKTFWGEDLLVVIPELVSLAIYRYRFFEEGLTKMLLKYLSPGMTFFDIGAHFGYFTMLGSKIVGKKGQVHSFEPTPSSFNILKTNVSKKDNVFLNKCAVFSERKTIIINDYGIKYSASNSIYTARLSQTTISRLKLKKHKIKAISIDTYVEKNDLRPDFVKIDAESSEYKILMGMKKTINKFHPIISIEVGDIGVNDIPSSKDLVHFLINKGYKPYEFKKGNIIEHNLKHEEYQYDNILFLPNK